MDRVGTTTATEGVMTQDSSTGRHTSPDPTGQVPPTRQGSQPPAGPAQPMPAGTDPSQGQPPPVDPGTQPGQPMPAGWEPDQPPAGQNYPGQITELGEPTPSTTSRPARDSAVTVRRSRFGGIWVGLIVAAVILILLLIFVLQNSQSAQVDFLWMSGHAPLAVAILLGGAAGALLVAVPGTVRILQLRKDVRNR